jgi:hypothetical protein
MSELKKPAFTVGDEVYATYIDGIPHRGTITSTFTISAERAEQIRKHYPDIEAGETLYRVTANKDTRAFHESELKPV